MARQPIAVRHRAALLMVCVVACATTSYNRAIRMPRRDARFAVDATGRHATRDAEWRLTLRSAGVKPIGLISAAAVCRGEAFLLDARQSVVHRIDLATGRETGRIGSSREGPTEPSRPRAMALDCEGRTLYLIDGAGVFVVDVTSELVVRRFPQPDSFVYTGGNAVIDAANETLFVPGVWAAARHDWLLKGLDLMFDGDHLGYRLSLRDGTTRPLFTPLERGCWSFSSDCLNAVFDGIDGAGRLAWVVAQTVSTQVGVFDTEYRLRRAFDIRSPRFRENGRRASSADSQIEAMRWSEANSVIRRVYAFRDRIVTIHTTNAAGWRPGQPIDFEVYMNIHTLDGQGLVSDVRLPDLPVARDDRNLFVIDYGAGGRRVGTQNVSLVRVPVGAGADLSYRTQQE